MGALYVTVNYYRSATTETFTFITQPNDPIGHPIPESTGTPSLLVPQSTYPPVNWSHHLNVHPNQLVHLNAPPNQLVLPVSWSSSQLVPPVNWSPVELVP